jgi:DNA-directed RNA polymerase specialized sigma subunit
MKSYPASVAAQKIKFYRSLNERERRRHAAIEASRLEHGGLEYISQRFGCDPKTIRKGLAELEEENRLSVDGQRNKGDGQRNKGADEKPK